MREAKAGGVVGRRRPCEARNPPHPLPLACFVQRFTGISGASSSFPRCRSLHGCRGGSRAAKGRFSAQRRGGDFVGAGVYLAGFRFSLGSG